MKNVDPSTWESAVTFIIIYYPLNVYMYLEEAGSKIYFCTLGKIIKLWTVLYTREMPKEAMQTHPKMLQLSKQTSLKYNFFNNDKPVDACRSVYTAQQNRSRTL